MDRPQIVSDTYLPEPYETQQWNCSVQAGLGDTLVWRLDGENISHIDVDNPNSTEVNYIVYQCLTQLLPSSQYLADNNIIIV